MAEWLRRSTQQWVAELSETLEPSLEANIQQMKQFAHNWYSPYRQCTDWCSYVSAIHKWCTVYPKKYAHGFVVFCFVVVMQSFITNSHEVFILIRQGCFAGTGAIVRLPQCQWSKPDGYGKISQCITTTKHSKAKTVCIFLGIYCILHVYKHLEVMDSKPRSNSWSSWFIIGIYRIASAFKDVLMFPPYEITSTMSGRIFLFQKTETRHK